jgi:hypothetical protein
MTAIVEGQQGTAVPPGWAVHANLLPPEVLSSRRLRVVRRGVLSTLAGFVALLVLLYLFVGYQHHKATTALEQEQTVQTGLQAQKASYSDVTDIISQVDQIGGLVSQVMARDVAVSKLLGSIRAAAPSVVGLTTVRVTLSPTGLPADSASGSSSLDTSGESPIGSVTIAGTGPKFTTAAEYAAALATIDGVVDVQPTTNSYGNEAFTFTISMTVTDGRLSGRYVPKGGGRK